MSMKNRLMAIVFSYAAFGSSAYAGLDSKVMAGTGAQVDPAHKAILLPNVERVQGFVRSIAVLVRRLPDIEMHLQADDGRRGGAVEETAVEHNLFATKGASK